MAEKQARALPGEVGADYFEVRIPGALRVASVEAAVRTLSLREIGDPREEKAIVAVSIDGRVACLGKLDRLTALPEEMVIQCIPLRLPEGT